MVRLRLPPRFLCAVLGSVLAVPISAYAEAVDGDYTSGPLREDYTVQNWQAQCGPVPKNTSTGGGGRASIRESGGVLSIASSERSYRTDRCYDTMPTLRAEPTQHDATNGTWRIRCTTPESDPRKALMQTLVAVGKDRVDVVETGRYEIRLQSGSCVADVRRSQSFTRVQPAAPAVVDAGAPEPERPAVSACDAPGPPQRFEVNPTRKVAVAGSEFRLRIDAFDAQGCATSPAPALDAGGVLQLETGARKDGLRNVTVRIPESAPEGPQLVSVVQGKAEAKVRVEIVSRARYEELFATGELQGLEEAPDGGGVEPIRFTTEATATSADGETRRRRFLALIGALLGVLVIAGIVLAIRGRKRSQALVAPAPAPRPAAVPAPGPVTPPLVGLVERPSQVPQRPPVVRSPLSDTSRQPAVVNRELRSCPVCHNEFEAPMQFCPHDGAQLGGGGNDAHGMICPICRRGFDASVQTCPDHGEELVPKTALGVAAVKRTQAKICPTCGERFEGDIAFCGKDGSALVVLN